jgi:hypothetical protein
VDLTLNYRPEGETHWSCRTIAAAAGVSKSTVQQVWSARGLKPRRVETFKLSNDPKFVPREKLRMRADSEVKRPTRRAAQ